MGSFSKFSPYTTLSFFVMAVVVNICVFNPIVLALSLVSSFMYCFMLNGKKEFHSLKFILPLMITVTIFNFIFSHFGESVLFEVFELPFTLQSLFYGFCQAMMLAGVIEWFKAYSVVITSEKFLTVFSPISPNLALVFSMTMSFIPRLRRNADEIQESRMGLDKNMSKMKKAAKNMSALISLTLEESIELSQSMKARGFGKGRSAYSKYAFNRGDCIILIFSLLLFTVSIVGQALGSFSFSFDPNIALIGSKWYFYAFSGLFFFLPIIIDLWEDIRWFYLKRKI